MQLDLDEIVKVARELEFEVDTASLNIVNVRLKEDVVLTFENFPATDDNVLGFRGYPWHSHDTLCLSSSVRIWEYTAPDILLGLRTGELLFVALYIEGALQERWIDRFSTLAEFEIERPGGELRITSLRSP